MRVIAGEAERAPVIAFATLVTSLASLTMTVVIGLPLFAVSLVALVIGVIAARHRKLLQWHSLLLGLLIVILFIPISKYTLPTALPFQLEPYRVIVLAIVTAWGASLLVDPRVRLRRSGLEGPLILVTIASVASVVANLKTISELGIDQRVAKQFSYTLTFVLILFFIVSTIRQFQHVHALVRVLVLGGVVLAVLAVVENRTNYNPFDHLKSVLPFLAQIAYPVEGPRGGRFRATGSAQHAIALGALLALLIPLGIYLFKSTGRQRWLLATSILGLGLFATVSRTGIVMILVEALTFLVLRPKETKRLWPFLLPCLVAIHIAVPGTLGALKDSFFPKGGIVAEQRGYKDSGRVGDLAPSLKQAAGKPLFGQGLGTRIAVFDPYFPRLRPTGRILDDQWLANLLEVGALGVLAWLWFFARVIRRLGKGAKEDLSDRGWLLTCLAASITGFAIGMFFYDAFSFTQVTFVMFILAGLGAVLLNNDDRHPSSSTVIRVAGT
jgi:hypothetical protein